MKCGKVKNKEHQMYIYGNIRLERERGEREEEEEEGKREQQEKYKSGKEEKGKEGSSQGVTIVRRRPFLL